MGYESLVDKELFDALLFVNDKDSSAATSILKHLESYIMYVSDEFISLFRAILVINDIGYDSNKVVSA